MPLRISPTVRRLRHLSPCLAGNAGTTSSHAPCALIGGIGSDAYARAFRTFGQASGPLFRREDPGAVLFAEWSAYQSEGLHYPNGDSWRCQACGTMTNLELHHKEFRSHTGGDVEENLITLCSNGHTVDPLRALTPSWSIAKAPAISRNSISLTVLSLTLDRP